MRQMDETGGGVHGVCGGWCRWEDAHGARRDVRQVMQMGVTDG